VYQYPENHKDQQTKIKKDTKTQQSLGISIT